jgi:transposase
LWAKVGAVVNAQRCPRQAGRCAKRIVHKSTAWRRAGFRLGILKPVSSTSRGRREITLARYGQAFKDRAVARLLPPESAALDDVSRDVGIGVDTLVRWRSDALSRPGRDRVWTAAARFDAVLTTAAMDETSKSAWCRANGTYTQQLATWQLNATQALAEPGEARASPLQTKQDRRRIKELERELLRKDRALAETAALLVLSKKVSAIFNTGAAE